MTSSKNSESNRTSQQQRNGSNSNNNNNDLPTTTKTTFAGKIQDHPYVMAGAGAALLVHLSALLSLPPAIRGRGAPFLPTTKKHSTAMFEQLREQLLLLSNSKTTTTRTTTNSTTTKSQSQQHQRQDQHHHHRLLLQSKLKQKKLTFVDLGSGDGRLVFRASREGIFRMSIGYEINPVLHCFAHTRRLFQAPKYWSSTQFRLRDIWKVDLKDVDVVAVYGLGPIMEPLGVKLKQELQPGSIVMSNVFSIPGWRPESTSRQGTHIYVVPTTKKGEEEEQSVSSPPE